MIFEQVRRSISLRVSKPRGLLLTHTHMGVVLIWLIRAIFRRVGRRSWVVESSSRRLLLHLVLAPSQLLGGLSPGHGAAAEAPRQQPAEGRSAGRHRGSRNRALGNKNCLVGKLLFFFEGGGGGGSSLHDPDKNGVITQNSGLMDPLFKGHGDSSSSQRAAMAMFGGITAFCPLTNQQACVLKLAAFFQAGLKGVLSNFHTRT